MYLERDETRLHMLQALVDLSEVQLAVHQLLFPNIQQYILVSPLQYMLEYIPNVRADLLNRIRNPHFLANHKRQILG